jgi:predicted P-loop ATPase
LITEDLGLVSPISSSTDLLIASDLPLKDETGARRFWPVQVAITRPIDTDLLTSKRDQLFAEAVRRFGEGEHWWPDDAFEREHIQPEQESRFESDAWEDAIRDHLIGKEKVLVLDVARNALGIDAAKLGTADQRRITAILERLGWERGKKDWKGNRWWVIPK